MIEEFRWRIASTRRPRGPSEHTGTMSAPTSLHRHVQGAQAEMAKEKESSFEAFRERRSRSPTWFSILLATTGRVLRRAPGVARKIFHLIEAEMKTDEAIEALVRRKIESQRREIPEGSSEWDVLYRKYYEEETAKHRKVMP